MCFLGLGRAKLKPNNLLQVKSCDFSWPEISLPGYPPPSQGWIWRSTSKRSLPPSNICSPHPPRQPAFRTDTIKDVLERKTFKSLYLATIFSSTSAFPLGIFSSVASSSSRLSILRSLCSWKSFSIWVFFVNVCLKPIEKGKEQKVRHILWFAELNCANFHDFSIFLLWAHKIHWIRRLRLRTHLVS